MSAFKKLLLFVGAGAPTGATVVTLVAPPFVKLAHAPAAESTAMCNCNSLADAMITSIFQVQLVGLALGAICGGVLFALLKRAGRIA